MKFAKLVGLALVLIPILTFTCAAQESVAGRPSLDWQQLQPIPNEIGLAGPIAGVHDDVLIVAGGANFPDGVPWHPGTDGSKSYKRYHDGIYFKVDWESEWKTAKLRLPKSRAYGANVSTSKGILCFGGQTETHEGGESTMTIFDDIVCLRFIDGEVMAGNEYDGKPLPKLPFATTSLSASLIGESVYLLSGETENGAVSQLWKLDLGKEELQFEELGPFPGEPRAFSIGVAQNDGRESCFYVFAGRNNLDGFSLFNDFWKYIPSERRWESLGEIECKDVSEQLCMMAGFGASIGANHILLGGGDSGVFEELNIEMTNKIAAAVDAGDEDLEGTLVQARTKLLDTHPGFSRAVLCFNAVTNKFYRIGDFPEEERDPTGPETASKLATGSHVTTTAVQWKNRIVIPTGEIAPGVRSDRVWSVELAPIDKGLGATNWVVMGIYLMLLVCIGLYFSRTNKSSEDYFLAGGRVPWWAAGLSVFATMLSAITYLAIPARAYGIDWGYFLVAMGIPFCCIFVMVFYLPFFRRLKLTSAYEYLEARFHWSLRVFGALTFCLFQFGRMGIVVLLPALALSAVTGINVYACIVTMGLLATVYTVMGGVEAVIWTDVLQTVVLFGGAIAAIVIISQSVDGGLVGVFEFAYNDGKLALVRNWTNHDLSWTKDGILVLLIGAVFSNLLPYSSDQTIVQRYMTVKDETAARRAIWVNALMCVPASFLFYTVGAALYVFFSNQPESLAPLAKSDQVFPWFFFFQLPAGLAGLVFAGVLAAAMSSLDSSMHSISTVISTDFYKRFNPEVDDQKLLSFAKKFTIALGIVGTVSACAMASVDIKYLLDFFLDIVGILLGPIGGLFALGIFVRRCGTIHAWFAVIVSTLLLVYLNGMIPVAGMPGRLVHPLVNGGVAMGACLIVGWTTSLLFPVGLNRNDELSYFQDHSK